MANPAYPCTITLGSGKLYVTEYDGELPDIDTMCVDENLLGLISGGAKLSYKPSFYEASDDLGLAKKNVLTSEDVTLTSGVITFNGETLAKLCPTARVDAPNGQRRTVKFGGAANDNNKSYALCFKHTDNVDGNKWVQIVGRNQAGFSLSFAKDKETVVDVEFKAVPADGEGTLVIYTEEDKSLPKA